MKSGDGKLDPNIVWKTLEVKEEMVQTLNDIVFHSDVVLPGIKEGRILPVQMCSEEIADFIWNMAQNCNCKSLGKPALITRQKTVHRAQSLGISRKIVDTVGAGDAFAAGVVTGLLENLLLDEVVARGNAMGAIIISSKGQ